MKALIDVSAASSGGGASRSAELARDLPALDPKLELTFMARHAVAESLRHTLGPSRVMSPPRRLSGTAGRLGWELLWVPARGWAHAPPDVVFSPFNIAPTLWGSLRPRIGVIVSNLAPFSSELRSLYRGAELARLTALRRLTETTLRRADRIFILSEQAHWMIGLDAYGERIELIPMAPPQLAAPSSPALCGQPFELENPEGRPTLLLVADLLRYKGIEWVLDAMSHLSADERPLLVIAGRPLEPSYASQLRELEARHRLEQDTCWLGGVQHERVLALMREVTGCIVPSRFENPGRVPVEAMASGIPVIATDIPSFREACGDAALYFPAGDAESLAEAIRALIQESSLRNKLVFEGQERIARLRPDSASQRIIAWIKACGA